MISDSKNNLGRRAFIGTTIAGAALASAAELAAQTGALPRPTETRKGDMLYRSFGKTGETVSVRASHAA